MKINVCLRDLTTMKILADETIEIKQKPTMNGLSCKLTNYIMNDLLADINPRYKISDLDCCNIMAIHLFADSKIDFIKTKALFTMICEDIKYLYC